MKEGHRRSRPIRLIHQMVCSSSDLRRFSSAVTNEVFVMRDEAAMILSAGSLLIVSGKVVEIFII